MLRFFLHVIQTIVHPEKHVGADLGAQAVAGAEVLVDPNLGHGGGSSFFGRLAQHGCRADTDSNGIGRGNSTRPEVAW